jgi:hypothetical protein
MSYEASLKPFLEWEKEKMKELEQLRYVGSGHVHAYRKIDTGTGVLIEEHGDSTNMDLR